MIRPRKAVEEMEGYCPPTSGREGYLRLDFNENTEGCSLNAIKALKSVNFEKLAVYPQYNDLKMAIADYCKVNPAEVIATNGTDEAIKSIFEIYLERGKNEVILPVPTYAMFRFYAQLNEASIKEVPYNNDLSFPTKKIMDSIGNKTKIIVLVNPNNPTGTSINEKDIAKIIKKAKEYGAIALIDEAYFQFCGRTSIPLIKKYDNLFVIQTFSKAFGLAGLRLGYVVSNNGNISIVRKAISPYSVNNAAVICAIAALKDLSCVKGYAQEVKRSKKLLCSALDYLQIKYYQSNANFVLIKIGSKAGRFCQEMRENGILVRNRSNDVLLDGCVRITLGTEEQTKRLISTISDAMKKINPLLILDIDGVLADASKSYRIAIKKTAEYFTGQKIGFKEIQYYKSRSGYNNDWDLTGAIIRSKGIEISKQKIIRKFQQYYLKLRNDEKWLLDKQILKNLSKRYRLAIFTGRPRDEADYLLDKNDVKKYFSEIVSTEGVKRQKPYPDGLLKIIQKMGGKDAYYFGDALDDIKAAIAAGIIPVGVLPPQDKSAKLRKILLKSGAKCVLKNINKIEVAII